MKSSRIIGFLTLLPLVGACSSFYEAHHVGIDIVSPELPADMTRICDIREQPEKYLGAIVRVRGIYKSDHAYYSYILDGRCVANRTIEVDHPINTSGDPSVRRFFSIEDSRCERAGGGVCPISWPIVADVLIRKQSNGRILAELKHVESFAEKERNNGVMDN